MFTELNFFVVDDGSVSYMINNEGKGQLLTGLKTKITLWPLFDLFGKVEEIAIIDNETLERGLEMLTDEKNPDYDSDDSTNERERKNTSRSSGYVVSFHSTHGQNIRMDTRLTTAKRFDSFWNALTFTQQPLKPFDITFIEVLQVEPHYAGYEIMMWF